MELALYDAVNRHQIYLEGLKRGNNRNFARVVVALDELIRDEIAGLPYQSLSDMTKRSLDEFVAKFRKSMIGIYDPWLRKLLEWFEEYIRTEAFVFGTVYGEYQRNEPLEEVEERDFWFPILAKWRNAPLGANGILPTTMLTTMIAGHVNEAANTIRRGYASGWTPAQTLEALRGTPNRDRLTGGLLNKFNAQAAAATNTVTQAASVITNAAVAALIFEKYEWVSVLDDRTTKICRRLDGKQFVYGKGPLPPAHVNCRSTVCPVTGEVIPDETFGVWAARQAAAFRKDAFDREPGSQYEGSTEIDLEEFRAKTRLILAVEG